MKLHKEGEHTKVAEMACSIAQELLELFQKKLSNYPSKNK